MQFLILWWPSTITLFSLLLHNCNFAAVMYHNVNSLGDRGLPKESRPTGWEPLLWAILLFSLPPVGVPSSFLCLRHQLCLHRSLHWELITTEEGIFKKLWTSRYPLSFTKYHKARSYVTIMVLSVCISMLLISCASLTVHPWERVRILSVLRLPPPLPPPMEILSVRRGKQWNLKVDMSQKLIPWFDVNFLYL